MDDHQAAYAGGAQAVAVASARPSLATRVISPVICSSTGRVDRLVVSQVGGPDAVRGVRLGAAVLEALAELGERLFGIRGLGEPEHVLVDPPAQRHGIDVVAGLQEGGPVRFLSAQACTGP